MQARAGMPKTPAMKPDEPIAITGIGCRYPGGAHGPVAFWQLLRDGIDAISEIPPDRWNIAGFYDPESGVPGKTNSRWGGFLDAIDQFDPEFFGISPREAASMDPQQRLLLETAWESLEDAGFVTDPPHATKAGVFVGISTYDYSQIQTSFGDKTSLDSHTTTGSVLSIAANRISYAFNFQGPSFVVDTACSSSLVAVHLACQSLRNGECTAALAGGVNAILIPDTFIGFSKMSMLSPDGRCKAFDARGNGFVRGEGAGVVVLKPLAAAQADGNRIYAVIRGSAINQDGRTSSLTMPGLETQKTLIETACRAAGVNPADINYVEAHGTGTAVGDPIEAAALGAVLGSDPTRQPCPIGSVKTNIGHLEAGSGIAGLIKTALVLHHQEIPPNLHFEQPNPAIDFEKWRLRIPVAVEKLPHSNCLASVNSFGFGGTNAHVILQGVPAGSSSEEQNADLFFLSAHDMEGLRAAAASFSKWLPASGETLTDICHTLEARRQHHSHRLAIVGQSQEVIAEKLQAFLAGETRPGLASGATRSPGKPVFVFTGQGPQWWAMGRELLKTSRVFRDTISECDTLFHRWGKWSLREELSRDEGSSRMDHPAIAQPSIFALQVGLTAWWREHGITPGAVIGHSVGEAAAACVAGALDLPNAAKVIFERGRCMSLAPATGRMLAAALSPEDAESWLAEFPGAVEIGAINSPCAITLTGDPGALERLAARLESAGIWNRFLRVNYAFHSAQMDPVEKELISALRRIMPQPPEIPICSTVTGQISTGNVFTADYWWQNVRRPVQFAAGIDTLLAAGFREFIEIGPHPVLAGSITECIRARKADGFVCPSLRRGDAEEETLLGSLGALHVRGHSVYRTTGGRHVSLPLHPWRHERYWHEAAESAASRLGTAAHPLLGRRLGTSEPAWKSHISPKLQTYLGDHQLTGRTVFPAAGYVEMALASGWDLHGDSPLVLEDVKFSRALFLPEDAQPAVVEFRFDPEGSLFQISSQHPTDSYWTTHARGELRAVQNARCPEPANLADIKNLCAEQRPGSSCYEMFRQNGFHFGPAFQGIARVHRRDGEALGEIQIPDAMKSRGYVLHPIILDSCFQVLLATLTPAQSARGLFLPVSISRMRFFQRPEGPIWSHVLLRESQSRSLAADIRLLDDKGNVLAEIEGFHCTAIEQNRTQPQDADDGYYELKWRKVPAIETTPPTGALLICAEDTRFAAGLEAEGVSNATELLAQLSGPRHVVYVAAPSGPDEAVHAQRLCTEFLEIVHILTNRKEIRLSVITRGAQPGAVSISPSHGALLGLARVVMNEIPALQCRVIDLDAEEANLDFHQLAAALASSDEDETALRGGLRLAPRLERFLPRPATVSGARLPFRLEITQPGGFDHVNFRELRRKPPGQGEVEIETRCAGLNFRDVMKVLGIYPIENSIDELLGDECAGRVTAVGAGVDKFHVGDEVLAISPAAFSQFLTVPAMFVARRPDRLSPAEAATIPVAFLTAHYALNHLARLARGERVLIHAAAGGVGLAALQIARLAGAEIFATAGSQEKRALVLSLGAAHVMDSRSLEFADEIRQITGGRGVDVVLNSLSGEAIAKSLSVLAPYGRFLEIGKRDIYQNSRLGLSPFRQNLSFSAIDLSQLLRDRPDFAAERLDGLMRQFERGELIPIRHKEYPVTEAPLAFREMAQGKHIGKIVLTMNAADVPVSPSATTRISFRPDATYLITGGVRGFGLAIADWMIERGARNLALLGASQDSARSAQAHFAGMEGVTAVCAAVDVSDFDALGGFLAKIQGEMPLLRGIIHAAMRMNDGLLRDLDDARFADVLNPKARGAWNLHLLTKNLPLDFFVMTSSISSLIGNPGQGNYAAANAFLDALAHHRKAQDLPALSVNWGHLGETGYASREGHVSEMLERHGLPPMSMSDALNRLERLLCSDSVSIATMRVNWTQWAEANPRFKKSSLLSEVLPMAEGLQSPGSPVAAIIAAPQSKRREMLESYVRDTAARVLGQSPSRLDPSKPLTESGLDSLMGIELVNRLEDGLGISFPTQKISGGPSIVQLAQILDEILPATTVSETTQKTSPVPEPREIAAEIPLPPAEAPNETRRNIPSTRHKIAHGFYLAGVWLARWLPLPALFLLGSGLGMLAFFILRKRRRLAIANIRMALGKDVLEARRLARAHFRTLGANLLSMLKIPTMTSEQIRRRVTVEMAPEIDAAPAGKGGVAVLSHTGNWELAGRLSDFLPRFRFGAIYQRLANPLIDADFKNRRARSGTTLFDRREGYWAPLAFLEAGGILGVLSDQNAGEAGVMTPFFGHPASTSTLAATLAQRTGADIVPVALRTVGIARWHIAIKRPFEKFESPLAATEAINRELEKQIASSPADWLWSHNRWKIRS